VAADDGRFLFGYERVANGTANIPTPIVKDNYVFCSSGYGTGAALLKLTAKGKNVTAQEVYYLPGDKFQNHHGGMIRIGNYIYAGHGHNEGFPVCLDMMSGQTKWGPGRGPGSGSAAIVAADGKLVFRYQNGVVALIDASPQKFNLRGTFQIPHDPGNSWPHPVIANGKLFLRVQDRLLCYDVKA
jgi:outer membrane protein assembly factor BamB